MAFFFQTGVPFLRSYPHCTILLLNLLFFFSFQEAQIPDYALSFSESQSVSIPSLYVSHCCTGKLCITLQHSFIFFFDLAIPHPTTSEAGSAFVHGPVGCDCCVNESINRCGFLCCYVSGGLAHDIISYRSCCLFMEADDCQFIGSKVFPSDHFRTQHMNSK